MTNPPNLPAPTGQQQGQVDYRALADALVHYQAQNITQYPQPQNPVPHNQHTAPHQPEEKAHGCAIIAAAFILIGGTYFAAKSTGTIDYFKEQYQSVSPQTSNQTVRINYESDISEHRPDLLQRGYQHDDLIWKRVLADGTVQYKIGAIAEGLWLQHNPQKSLSQAGNDINILIATMVPTSKLGEYPEWITQRQVEQAKDDMTEPRNFSVSLDEILYFDEKLRL